MMRSRAYRRHMEEVIVRRRLRNIQGSRRYWYSFSDKNGIRLKHPDWHDLIGTYTQYMYKTHTTKYNDSKHKTKYSSHKNKGYWRKSETRETDKIKFRKLLKEYGLA